jgi:hypothetical protein
MLCQGANGYRVISRLGNFDQLIHESRTRLCDQKGGIRERAETLIPPAAFSLGLDGDRLAPVTNLFSDPITYGSSSEGLQRSQWSESVASREL